MEKEIYRGSDIGKYNYGEFKQIMEKIKALYIISNDGSLTNINPFQIWLKEEIVIKYIKLRNRATISLTIDSLIIDDDNIKEENVKKRLGILENKILKLTQNK